MGNSNGAQVTADQWNWEVGKTHYSVRVFPSSRTLIWSLWTEMGAAPQFGDGIKQSFDRFLESGAPQDHNVPDEVLESLRQRIENLLNPPAKRKWQFWK